MSCQVCTDEFNKVNKQVKCSCDYECCVGCAETYMLSKTQNAHCMNCKVAWNKEFLVNNFGHSFIVKKYQPLREKILYERELCLLPEAQAFIDNEKRQKAIREEIDNLTARINILKRELRVIGNEDTPIIQKEFIRQCPNTECNGFLSEELHCSLCGIDACGKCREIKVTDPEHVCNEDVVKTVALLKKDTKECPSCAALIFRISGCSQMFCTSCHKVFDWNTLKLFDTGVVHNPHYFEWVRRNGRAPDDIPEGGCNRYLTHHAIYLFSRQLTSLTSLLPQSIRNENIMYSHILERTLHIREVDMRRNRRDIRDNLNLRVKFLQKEINVDKFKTRLRINEKHQEKCTELYNVLDMYTTCVSDLVNVFLEQKDFSHFKNELEQLRVYTKEQLLKISQVFKCKLYEL